MRITIVGQGGSGKTYLAKALHKKYGYPVIHIDRIWIKNGGEHTETETEREHAANMTHRNVLDLIKQSSWISEGFYGRIQPKIARKADLVIYLPRTLRHRVKNHLKRSILRDNRHPELGRGDDLRHTFRIIRGSNRQKSDLKKVLQPFQEKMLVLNSRKEVNDFFCKSFSLNLC